jgi:hypothetical protein
LLFEKIFSGEESIWSLFLEFILLLLCRIRTISSSSCRDHQTIHISTTKKSDLGYLIWSSHNSYSTADNSSLKKCRGDIFSYLSRSLVIFYFSILFLTCSTIVTYSLILIQHVFYLSFCPFCNRYKYTLNATLE